MSDIKVGDFVHVDETHGPFYQCEFDGIVEEVCGFGEYIQYLIKVTGDSKLDHGRYKESKTHYTSTYAIVTKITPPLVFTLPEELFEI